MYNFILFFFFYCSYLADPATFLASNIVLRAFFFFCLFIQLWKKKIFLSLYHCLINIVMLKLRVWISSPKQHSAPLNTSLTFEFHGTIRYAVAWTQQPNCNKNNFSSVHVCVFLPCFWQFYRSLYLIELYNGGSHNMSDLSWSGCFGFFCLILPSVRSCEEQSTSCVRGMQDCHQHAPYLFC